MERRPYPGPSTSAAHGHGGHGGFSLDDDPYALELDRLDVLDIADNNQFMTLVIDAKKNLLEEASVMRKLMRLDELNVSEPITTTTTTTTNQLLAKAKKTKAKSVSGLDDVQESGGGNDGNTEQRTVDEAVDEEASDEEEELPEDELDEDNDYMESYFENGEDFVE